MAKPTSPVAEAPPDDPYERHVRRESRRGAAVRVVVLDGGHPEQAEAVGAGLVALLQGRNRRADLRVVPIAGAGGIGPAIERGYGDSDAPLVLVTHAAQPWTEAHLRPLLEAIEACDHAIGRRPATRGRLLRWLSALRWRLVFSVPVLDVHSPCRLHRREALGAIPLQSGSSLADLEVLAKATFLGHLIDEVGVPELAALPVVANPIDRRELFRRPRFRREPTPAAGALPDERAASPSGGAPPLPDPPPPGGRGPEAAGGGSGHEGAGSSPSPLVGEGRGEGEPVSEPAPPEPTPAALPSAPAEQPQGQPEGGDRPGGQHDQ